MILVYKWEDVTVNRECDYGGNTLSPHTKPSIEDVEYEYDVTPTMKDVIRFLVPKEENYSQALKVLELLESVDAIDYEALEQDADFVGFMLKHYERVAWREFEEQNCAY